MGIEQFLRIISEKFDLESAKRITSSLHQDQLIWKSLANAELRSSFATYAADIKEIWTVGHLVRHVLINNNYPDINYPDLNNGLSEFERHKVFENYQTTKKTLLPPVDLFEVGLLALYLREYRITNKNWKGVNEIFTPFIDKIKVWPTVFAALPEFIPDVESFYLEFLAFKTKKISLFTVLTGEPKFSGAEKENVSGFKIVLNTSYSPIVLCPFELKYKVVPSG